MYMNYCRYEGTYKELWRCLNDVEAHVGQYAEYEVSDDEIQWFRNIVELFHDFLCEQRLMDENGNLDMNELDKICETMSQSYEEEDEDEE